MMVNVMDFSIKILELSVQTIFIYQRWNGGMEYAMSTLMLGNGTLEEDFLTARMKWDILGSTRFGFK
jgi:uncharacterized protein (DUF608 family)